MRRLPADTGAASEDQGA